MSSFSHNWLYCLHLETTAPDNDGETICLSCCAVTGGRLNLGKLQKTLDFIAYGASYEDADGNRIDPRDLLP